MKLKEREKKKEKEYVLSMRKEFSSKNSILPNGELNHKYFQFKIGQYWSEVEEGLLMKGLGDFGVGKWDQIKKNLLKNVSETELKQRTCLILKKTNIESFLGKKLEREEILKIAKENEIEGTKKGKFKYGLYFNEK